MCDQKHNFTAEQWPNRGTFAATMGNLLAGLASFRSWVSSSLFVIQFRVMRLLQYCSAMLAPQPRCLADIERHARRILMKDIHKFYASGSKVGSGQTLMENLAAYSRYRVRPRYIRDTSDVDLRVTLLGEEIDFPVCIAPTGFHSYLHWEGEIGTARASTTMNTCMVLSAFSSVNMEDVAKSGGNGLRWFHLMLTLSDDLIKEHVMRAEKAGFKALVITIDQPTCSGISATRVNVHIFDRKFVNFPLMNIPPGEPVNKYVSSNCFSAAITWEKIEWVCTLTSLPIVLKGILTAEDAKEAVKHNVNGIIVSNHGGRQLDSVPATIDVIEEVATAVGDKIEVYVDGGIRQGTDIFKALARGGKAVFIGRPALWGLAYKGSKGVEEVLSILKDELKMTMQLAGCTRLSDIKKDMVVHESYYSHFKCHNSNCVEAN